MDSESAVSLMVCRISSNKFRAPFLLGGRQDVCTVIVHEVNERLKDAFNDDGRWFGSTSSITTSLNYPLI